MNESSMRDLVSMLESIPGSALWSYYEDTEDKALRKGLVSFIKTRDRLISVLCRRIYHV